MLTGSEQLIHPLAGDAILSIIHAAFGSEARVAVCQTIDGGHFNTLYDIQVLNPDRRVVLRVAPPPDRSLLRYERTMMLAEPHIYDLISRAGIPTCRVLAVDGSRSLIDRDYIITEYVDAVPMSHASVPAGARTYLMREVGRYTARMHTIRGERFGWIMPDGTIRGSQSWAEVLGELLDEAYAKAREAGVITGSEAEAAAGSLQSHLDVFDECRSPVLVHNDIWDPNILVGESEGAWRVKAIIDADRALFADREFEFALWDGPDPDFLSGYGRPIDSSPNAVLRRQFYRMQLYIQYAWFYLVMKPSPEFQASAKRTALDALEGILGMPLAG